LAVCSSPRSASLRTAAPPATDRRNFFVYIDEFQSFTTLAVASMLSELRKYRVGFTIAHQYLYQLESDVRHAVLGNVGSIISFRVGADDAPYLVREFHERFLQADFLQLPRTMLTPCLWCHHLPGDHVRAGKERYCRRCDCRYYAHAKPRLAANRLVGRLRRTER
jgi:hypothetical protein